MEPLDELAALVARHARPGSRTAVDGLLLSRVDTAEPEYSLTEPLLVLMVRGRKRMLLGDHVIDHRAGDGLVVTADLPVSGHFAGASIAEPALGVGVALRPEPIAALLPRLPQGARSRDRAEGPAMATGPADPELLDAVVRLVRLLERPADIGVLAPGLEREILWRLLTGPHAAAVAQIGRADSELAHLGRAIAWLRANYAEPVRIADLAGRAGMSLSAFHRRFRTVTGMSPLQFQKQLRLQEARTLLLARSGDATRVAHTVGYASASQFSREYRRFFGAPPLKDTVRLRGG